MLGRTSRKFAAALTFVAGTSLAPMAAIAAQGQPVTVYAQPDENLRTERVSFADLDLSTAQGERTLARRVGGAVKRVCLYESGYAGLQMNEYYRCADGAWDHANPQIAQATARAKDIALNGTSSIAAVAITISGS